MGIIVLIASIVLIFGSNTFIRRQHMEEESQSSYDEAQEEVAHLTGDVLNIHKSIIEGTLEEGYLSKAEEKTFLELYDIANKKICDIENVEYLKRVSIAFHIGMLIVEKIYDED